MKPFQHKLVDAVRHAIKHFQAGRVRVDRDTELVLTPMGQEPGGFIEVVFRGTLTIACIRLRGLDREIDCFECSFAGQRLSAVRNRIVALCRVFGHVKISVRYLRTDMNQIAVADKTGAVPDAPLFLSSWFSILE